MKKLDKKSYVIIAVVAVLVLWGLCCLCCCNKGKVATVNAQMVVSRSVAIRNLQHEQQVQYEELQKWLQESDKAIKKQPTQAKKKELMMKLQGELQQKQIVMQQEYAAKTQKIEEEIVGVIEKVAHKKGFKVVLDKNTVIAGGVDITEDVVTKLEEAEADLVVKEAGDSETAQAQQDEVSEPVEEAVVEEEKNEAPKAEEEVSE